MSNSDHIEKLIRTHERRLEVLEKQQAAMGILTPPYIVTEIETAKEEIEKLRRQLSPTAITPVSGMEKGIFISYAWGGESEEVANQLEAAFQARGVTIVRDKRNLGYKGRIKEFMERIGRGKAVLVVISDKYLKSENCTFELVQIAENGQFYDRIFPVVLADARIYDPLERFEYITYWEEKINNLNKKMKEASSLANLPSFNEAINQYTKIRNTIDQLVEILKDMNTLTPEMHNESGFEELFEAVERKMAE